MRRDLQKWSGALESMGCQSARGLAHSKTVTGLLSVSVISLTLVFAEPVSAAPSTPTRPDYSAFKLITERNIFNAKRSPKYVAPASTDNRRIAPTESLALTGTMRDEKGPLAFFDGSSSQYRKVLKPNDTIAGFTLEAVEHAYVKLKNGTNEVTLPVNMQLARKEEGEWQLTQRSESMSSSSSSSEPTQASTGSTRISSDNGGGRRSERGGSRERRGGSENGRSVPGEVLDAPPPGIVMKEAPGTVITNGAPPSASSGSEADVLEILRRRREQENNQ